jgi:hypothetical protein
MPNATTLEAWKQNEGGTSISPCSLDDPDAIEFRLRYVGKVIEGVYGGSQTFKSKDMAEDVQRAMERVFEAGKQAAKAELRAWLQT